MFVLTRNGMFTVEFYNDRFELRGRWMTRGAVRGYYKGLSTNITQASPSEMSHENPNTYSLTITNYVYLLLIFYFHKVKFSIF